MCLEPYYVLKASATSAAIALLVGGPKICAIEQKAVGCKLVVVAKSV